MSEQPHAQIMYAYFCTDYVCSLYLHFCIKIMCSLISDPIHVCIGMHLMDCVDYPDARGNTPLNMACSIGNLPIVKKLLKHGADSNARNILRMSPLQTACSRGYVPIVKAILEYNHKSASELVQARFTRSNTVMHCVADSGDLEMMEVLLRYGAIPSMRNDNGVAPIHYAAGKGHVNIARKLLERDVSEKDLLDKQHRSPLHYAAKTDQVNMIKLLLFK